MSKILYHADDDGRCAAAIVVRGLCSVFDKPEMEDCYEYSHGRKLEINEDDIRDGESVFIVDLALDDVIMNAIRLFREHKCVITHIDHHKTTIDRYDEFKEELESVRTLYMEGVSGALLTFIYSCMTNEERIEPGRVPFDFAEKRSHFCFNYDQKREYRVPMAIRFIDDRDVWRHDIDGTDEFHIGFSVVDDKHPLSPVWNNLVDGNNAFLLEKSYLEPGRVILNYLATQYKFEMRRSFVSDTVFRDENGEPVQCLFLNHTGSSDIFGDEIKNHPMACLYYYDGRFGDWKYQLRSCDDGVDVEKIARSYGGGGHKHAAGFRLTDNIVNLSSDVADAEQLDSDLFGIASY